MINLRNFLAPWTKIIVNCKRKRQAHLLYCGWIILIAKNKILSTKWKMGIITSATASSSLTTTTKSTSAATEISKTTSLVFWCRFLHIYLQIEMKHMLSSHAIDWSAGRKLYKRCTMQYRVTRQQSHCQVTLSNTYICKVQNIEMQYILKH